MSPSPVLKKKKEEYTQEEIQSLLIDLQYALQEVAPGNYVVDSFFRMGKLQITPACKTAGVAVDHEGQVYLSFAPAFVEEILQNKNGKKMLEFVLMHECMHVILDHITRREKRQPFIWNIACDAIVNATVLDIFSGRFKALPASLKGGVVDTYKVMKDKDIDNTYVEEMNKFFSTMIMPHSIEETVESCTVSCAEELYEKLLKKAKEMLAKGLKTLDNHGMWEESKGKKTAAQKLAEEQMKEVLKDAMGRAIKNDNDARSKFAGKQPYGEFRELGIDFTVRKLPWDRMLRNFIASRIDEFTEEVWHNPSRKLRQFYPRVVLPNEFEDEERKKLLVTIFVDTSGSMDETLLKKVQGILSCFPADKVEYDAYSFDADIYKIDEDITKCKRFRGGGGTSFQLCADKVHEKPTHSDCVIMITDGFDSAPKLKLPNCWLWLIVPGGRAPFGKLGTIVQMN